MPLNNPNLYNAAVIGVSGGGVIARWPIDTISGNYSRFANDVKEIGIAIDSAIPTITRGPTPAQISLMQSLCQGIFDRYPVDQIDFTQIAASIAAAFTEISNSFV